MGSQGIRLTRKPHARNSPAFPTMRPADVPAAFHVLAKPTGAICNLDCEYCFYLEKEALYPGDRFRMPDEVLEEYLRQLLEAHRGTPEVTIAWQGGEPTLMGAEFFARAVSLAERHRAPGQVLSHTIQTNGTLLTDELCALFAEKRFLVGISIDGPPRLHDRYRVDKRGRATSERVLAGLAMLQRHGVQTNVLCTVHRANQDHALEVYRYFRDTLETRHVQLIPIVEVEDGPEGRPAVSERSVEPEAYGEFLCAVFDEWLRRDVGTVYVGHFDAALASWVGAPPAVCIFAETCGNAVALEHNGDLYSCDHFVDEAHLLGNLLETHLVELVASPQQRRFGDAKASELPRYCRECDVRFACNGECPKNRILATPDGEEGLNYLCAGYKRFFGHIDPVMRMMADRLRAGGFADEVMATLNGADRNAPCPCGSGVKAKRCHGR